jgi:hypothetical protein
MYQANEQFDNQGSLDIYNLNILEHTFQEDSNKAYELQLAQDEYLHNIMRTQESGVREQKKFSLQSTLDRNMYNRSGDDPCTSGVSMCSSDIRQDTEESKHFQAEQTDQCLNINTLVDQFRSKHEYVWYATYEADMKDYTFYEMIEQCSNNSMPLNKVSIKLEEYDVAFANVNQLPGLLYLQRKMSGSCFIKLFLIHKDQIIDLAVAKNRKLHCNYTMSQAPNFEFIDKGQCFLLDEMLPYGYGVLIGNYENYPIYSLTNYQIHENTQVKNV